MQWRDATVSETGVTGFEAPGSVAARQEPDVRQVFDQVSIMAVASSAAALPVGLDLPCTEDPELFFAESPEDVETAKAMCRGCEARLACLTRRGRPLMSRVPPASGPGSADAAGSGPVSREISQGGPVGWAGRAIAFVP